MLRDKITYLDGIRLYRGMLAGIRQVLSKQNYLNKINVFPVPDGDTGTNMGFTLLSIADGTDVAHSHAGRTAVAIADAALDGARGNSGVILAQFLQGFSDSCAELRRMTGEHFAKAMQQGYDYALEAMTEPVEGTILSVIKASHEKLRERVGQGIHDFYELLSATCQAADEALKRTPEQLAILKKNGVVDAGGQGFVYILNGILDFISDGSLRDGIEEAGNLPKVEIADQVMEAPGAAGFRYCTECMVTGQGIPIKLVKEQIMGLGNSVVIGGSKTRTKIHIHTNRPQEVFKIAGTHGAVTGEKIDDMHKQVEVAHRRQGRVAIVTDSTADIPLDIIDEFDIHIVPAKLSFGNTRYQDKVSITPDEFYHELRTNPDHPKTSQPTPGDFWRQYQFLGSHYDSIISIHLPLTVSGTIQSAQIAAGRLPDVHISVIDGENTTVGLGLIATAAARKAKAGKNHDEILKITEKAVKETTIYAAIADLSYAVKGGRVRASKQKIADFLRATPVLTMTDERKVDMDGIFLGKKDLAKGLAKYTAKRVDLDTTYDVVISHGQAPEQAERLQTLLPEVGIQANDVKITDTGVALGVHAGPGNLIIALLPVGIA